MVLGTWLAWTPGAWVPVHALFGTGIAVYNGLIGLAANIVVAVVLSALLPKTAQEIAATSASLPQGNAT
jgi:SSS family solute:Na+ symporter